MNSILKWLNKVTAKTKDYVIICPKCGIKNTTPFGKPLAKAKCGGCNQSLEEDEWAHLTGTSDSKADLSDAKERDKEAKERAVQERERVRQELFSRNEDLVEKFLQIADRKVSIIDDYGDENWDVLPGEILTCLKKIAQREKKNIDWKSYAKYEHYLPDDYKGLRDKLENVFRAYHKEHQSEASTMDELHNMSGIEFETWVVKVLKENGFNDVRGTPTTGDQGADIIANKEGRNIIIQTKRHKSAVGNKAVQEVIGAMQYYGGNEGWVITNSTFTSSAIALAQKSKIKLIDGKALSRIQDFIK